MSKGIKNILILDPIRDRKKVAEMYQASDVYVLPSFREGLPLTLIEAMASGIPIIASPVNGVPYEMKDNYNGFFVEYGDIKNLKNKIIKIIEDKKLSDKFRKNNIKAAGKYNWDLIEKRTTLLYKK